MKKLFYLISLLCCLGLSAQTTWEEYNYITKGYPLQLDTGQDPLKKDYIISLVARVDLPEGFEKENLVLERLVHRQRGTVALILKRQNTDKSWSIFAIPHPDSNEVMIEDSWNELIGYFKGRYLLSVLFYTSLFIMTFYEFNIIIK